MSQTRFTRGKDGIVRHAVLLTEEREDDELWEVPLLALVLMKRETEEVLDQVLVEGCDQKYGELEVQKHQTQQLYERYLRLDDNLEAITRELYRRGVLPPVVSPN